MNQVVPRPNQPLAASRTRPVAVTVLANEDQLLDIDREFRELSALFGKASREGDAASSGNAAAQLMISLVPAGPHLDVVADRIATAIAAVPDDRVNRILVGLLLDALPNARPANPETYIEALIHDLRSTGYGPAVVAYACRELRRSPKGFTPSIGEVIEACSNAKATMHRWPGTIGFMAHQRAAAVRRLEVLQQPANNGGVE